MNPQWLQLPVCPELQAWATAEEFAIERLLELSIAAQNADPARAMQLMIVAQSRARELLTIRDLLDLP